MATEAVKCIIFFLWNHKSSSVCCVGGKERMQYILLYQMQANSNCRIGACFCPFLYRQHTLIGNANFQMHFSTGWQCTHKSNTSRSIPFNMHQWQESSSILSLGHLISVYFCFPFEPFHRYDLLAFLELFKQIYVISEMTLKEKEVFCGDDDDDNDDDEWLHPMSV